MVGLWQFYRLRGRGGTDNKGPEHSMAYQEAMRMYAQGEGMGMGMEMGRQERSGSRLGGGRDMRVRMCRGGE